MSPSRRDTHGVQTTLLARGEPMLWLAGASLAICIAMITALLVWVAARGFATFWPAEVVAFETVDGGRMGEVVRDEWFTPEGETEPVRRRMVRTGNFDLTDTHFEWILESDITSESTPETAVVLERIEWGRFYGFPETYADLHFVQVGVDLNRWDEQAARDEANRVAERLRRAPGAESIDLLWAVERRRDSVRLELLLSPEQVRPGDRVFAVAEAERGTDVAWAKYEELHDFVAEQRELIHDKRKQDIGDLAARTEEARIALREVELELEPHPAWVTTRHAIRAARLENDETLIATLERRLAAIGRDLGEPPQAYVEAFERYESEDDRLRAETERVTNEIEDIARGAGRHAIWFSTANGGGKLVRFVDIVRAYPANRLGFGGRLGVYTSRWAEFLTDDPRESNNEGGVFPAIFGTVLMTLLMCVAVVPFGVLAALYLREYAKAGPMISLIRIAVNNLAGVPSIVFGVFGLGFFCYIVGASIDDLLFEARLPAPTFGKSGMLWASLTLSLMTLPVVIVATEEALAAVPSSVREGSFGCGASKWQTIHRIVLPRAMPGIMTGAILAMARGAGEVAPLMLVGAVKLAPELPIDVSAPFGLDRSFMHLGFHIYDLGFQSPNADAAKPMVYTTTLLLITIIAFLNLAAIWLRTRLRRKFVANQF